MVERIKSRREARGRRGGKRKNAGRPAGGVGEAKQVARARAKMTGMLPDELLLLWARTGKMDGALLDPQQRMYAANAAAPYYKSKLQPRAVEGQQPPTYRVELDVAKLAGLPTDKLAVMREVLQMMAKGMPSMADLVPTSRADPAAYARTLRPDSKTEGRA